jgi:tetratricopeptide (TPR) repeat protein
MMRLGFLFIASFLLLACPNCAYPQIFSNTDSLHTLLQNSAGEQRAELLLELSHQIRRSNSDSAITYAREALDVSQRLENQFLKAESHRRIGRLLSVSGKIPEALEHLLQAKEIFEQTGALQKEALVLKNLGALYKYQSDYKRALGYYYGALNLNEQLNYRSDLPDILMNIAVINERMNQPENSLEFYKRALIISEEMESASDIAITATSMGDLYASMGKTDQALKAMEKALEASENLPGAHAKATILMRISSVYNDKNSYQQALEANNKALALARSMPDNVLESLALKNIASVYEKQGDYSKANDYLLQTVPLLKETKSQQLIIENRNRIARNYIELDDYEASTEYGEQAYESAVKARVFDLGVESLQILSVVYQRTDQYQKAVTTQKRLTAFKDSIYKKEQARQIADMQTRYETKQKEQEITLLQKEKEKAQLIRNAFIAGLLLIFIIGFLIYNRQRLKIKKNRTDLENRRLKEQQLKQDVASKNKQLTTHSLNLVQKNEVMKELKENIRDIREAPDAKVQKKLQSIEHLVDYSFNLDEDWEEFKLYFEEVHTGFFETLKQQYPDLTPNELRLSALVKLNLTSKEIATIIGISPDSVKTARYRLRKKLDMETEENLTEFMMDVEKEVSNI